MSVFRVASPGSLLRRLTIPAFVSAVLFAVAVGGLIVAQQQHGTAVRAQATTDGALHADAAAADVLLDSDAGVREYVKTGDLQALAPYHASRENLRAASSTLGRLLTGGSADAAFVSQAARYLTT